MPSSLQQPELDLEGPPSYSLRVTLDFAAGCIRLAWNDAAGQPAAELRITCSGSKELTWEFSGEAKSAERSSSHLNSIRARMNRLANLFPVAAGSVKVGQVRRAARGGAQGWQPLELPPHMPIWSWLQLEVQDMARALGGEVADSMEAAGGAGIDADEPGLHEGELRRIEAEERLATKQEADLARFKEALVQQELERQRREARSKARAERAARAAAVEPPPPEIPRLPLPEVPLRLELAPAVYQDTLFPKASLRDYLLQERARVWWISNQTDDLLCLPYCAIERLDYQLRTALRVIGPLRGRALLSDEVGLGKTIEAGLVLKEYLTRGLVKRFLVLTVPSLVDQWQEELEEKFRLDTVTTNQPGFRADPVAFWREHVAVVASLHTLKQPAHLGVAQAVSWDMLIVDEAHYLRNRNSQAWQAVNSLPRQFMLLLTATPVQNSLEELYSLVTLLQPGQLPAPKEFQTRFIDRKHPRRPREPEELRRLLGQVMVRNTRANAGVALPPRRAETVLFDPETVEATFWQEWEQEFRAALEKLSPSQASLWGRLLLQAAGSSPHAWRSALAGFPQRDLAGRWARLAPLEASWRKKCELVAPLSRGEGGAVVFTQFLDTQAALAEALRAAKLPVWTINGQTPPPERHPITEQFRRHAGALLLTHCGTEGRNLQFCHRLVNFDLPWNPMEIEQRIGRLHRLGQRHPVRIHNLVQRQTLQEHLLDLLQEKLNLFELVVGETGLVLGDRFSSDEFAEEVFRRWRESEGDVGRALTTLGDELAAARDAYDQVKALDTTLFARDYETL